MGALGDLIRALRVVRGYMLRVAGAGLGGAVPVRPEASAVAMMVRNGSSRGKVTINHAPCGYGQFLAGCHQYRPDFLPPGHRMTVLGTDAQGNPFRQTYEAKAPL